LVRRELALTHHLKGKIMNPATAAILFHDTCSPRQLMQITQSGRNSTYASIKSGETPSFRVGNNIKIPTSWLRAKLGIATEVTA
jgi:hypothetical protein